MVESKLVKHVIYDWTQACHLHLSLCSSAWDELYNTYPPYCKQPAFTTITGLLCFPIIRTLIYYVLEYAWLEETEEKQEVMREHCKEDWALWQTSKSKLYHCFGTGRSCCSKGKSV